MHIKAAHRQAIKNSFILSKKFSQGWLAQWKNVRFVKSFVSSDRGSNLTIRQVFFMRDFILQKRHDAEASKHVGKNLANSQSEMKLAAVEHATSE